MRPSSRLRSLVLVTASALQLSCSSSEYPNPILTFNMGQEDDAYDDVVRFDVERVDSNGKSTRIYREDSLPESIDMGNGSEYYQYVATGYDADGNRLAVGRTMMTQASSLLGSEVPMFVTRTDRAGRPTGNFSLAMTQYPVAAILSDAYIWYMDDVSDALSTDSYSIAYWDQVDPSEQYQSITCVDTPCNLKNLVVVGGVYAIAISDDWALFVNVQESIAVEYAVSEIDGLDAWSDVAGGRVLPGASYTALIAGPTRLETPTTRLIGFSTYGYGTVFDLNQARAGAALLAEEDFGLVLVGGSSEGAGVEVLPTNEDADADTFVALDYPADPVVGAALVMEDDTHLLRVGGLTTDGADAPTVRIDMACEADCAYEAVTDLNLSLRVAQSYYDPATEETLIVGENADGLTQVYRYTGAGFSEVAFPAAQKRIHATALELPNQQLGLIGGTDPNDEDDARTAISVVAF